MLTKRIIPCLDIKDGRTVKGVNFLNLTDAGDPVELATLYAAQGADELVFLDISATEQKRKTFAALVERIAKNIDIPFVVGGGITSVEDVNTLLRNGADKVSVNSSAVRNPALITELAEKFGSQCVVVAIDAKQINGRWKVHLVGGKTPTDIDLFDWAKQAEALGAGEILFTSMDHDGSKSGFACEALQRLSAELAIPVIASGGAGTIEHFITLFEQTSVSAALAAGIFHYGDIPIQALKTALSARGIHIRI